MACGCSTPRNAVSWRVCASARAHGARPGAGRLRASRAAQAEGEPGMRRAGGDKPSGPELAAGVAVLLWQYRLELASAGVAVTGQRLLTGRIGDAVAAILVMALLTVLAAFAPVRRLAWRA